jgi:2-oxoglutarate dehydrogenase E1 component
MKDKNRDKTIGVLIHGDAALAGQGIVYESLQLQDLVDYTTGGIIHIVMNNQVGFTTNPWQSRSSFHCTEIAKVIGAPIIHVNADEPDLLDNCMQIAVQYRQKFKKDIFIDIVGYRRFGHNEQDQPFFTQPKMYEKIKNHSSVFEKYSEKCVQTGAMSKEEIETVRKEFMKEYEEDYKKVMSDKTDEKPVTEDPYYEVKTVDNPQLKTGASKTVLSDIFKKITSWPQDFTLHPTIKKIFEERIKNFTNNESLDWATMESLAFGTLLDTRLQTRTCFAFGRRNSVILRMAHRQLSTIIWSQARANGEFSQDWC